MQSSSKKWLAICYKLLQRDNLRLGRCLSRRTVIHSAPIYPVLYWRQPHSDDNPKAYAQESKAALARGEVSMLLKDDRKSRKERVERCVCDGYVERESSHYRFSEQES
jgi:hypothetical protein